MKTICHLSGGFDSAASTLIIAQTGVPFSTLLIDLGQPYCEQEKLSAVRFSQFLAQRFPAYEGHRVMKVDMALQQQGTVSAYIPVRNMVIGAMSANLALSQGYSRIAVGNKTLELRPNDPYCFNDCSRQFYDEMGTLATFASQGQKIEYVMPLIMDGVPMTKRDVVLTVKDAGFDPRGLWSCYENTERPCGECHHCQELKAAGVWHLVF